MMKESRFVPIRSVAAEMAVSNLGHPFWAGADAVTVDSYWSGARAPHGRSFESRMLWSRAALYIRFDALRNEPMVVSEEPVLDRKTVGLWNRDVCEIFVAPNASEPRKYFEFEVAPTGEWLDVSLDLTSGTRKSDWLYSSGMESFACIESDKVLSALKIPWSAFGQIPKAGDVWLGNLLRCVGKDPDRGYLAWQPTMTELPDFHVPERFGEFHFLN
jgi:alpha-galactosidase